MTTKIFWQLGSAKKLTPTSGDQITELNNILAVSQFAQVKYGGDPRGCDIYYVRNNPSIVKKIKDGKIIYFASPYDRLSYQKADYIATFTDAWTRRMKDGTVGHGLPKTQNVITIHQTVNPMFKPYKKHKKTLEIRKKIGGDFIIGHFGALRKSCYPYSLTTFIEDITECYPNVRFVFGGAKLPFRGVVSMDFTYRDMPYAISACDMILYNMWQEDGHIAGSMKILESMACGVPVMCPTLDARVDELGPDYPMFYPWKRTATGYYIDQIRDEMRDMMEYYINEPNRLKSLSNYCYQRSRFYSVAESAKRLKKLFEGL